jgi:hypothetical protein
LECQRTFIWLEKYNIIYRRQHWFKLWVTENYSIRQLSKISGYSNITLTRIKEYWLEQNPKEIFDFGKVQYLVFDATYFHKDGCLLNLMEARSQKIIAHLYVKKESFKDSYPWFQFLKQKGLSPSVITTDGERSVLRAMHLDGPRPGFKGVCITFSMKECVG